MSSSRICVLSGRYPRSSFSSIYNHRAYCNRHQYTYIHCTWPSGQDNPYLNKLAYVCEYFDFFDFVFWIDDDAFFLDIERPLTHFLPPDGKSFSVCSSPSFKSLKTFLSSGQFALRCDDVGKDLMASALQLDGDVVREWWSEEYGFFTGGDQDRLVYLLNTQPQFRDAYELWDYKCFNSRVENLFGEDPHSIFVLHFTGKRRKKIADYARVQRKLERGPSLLTKDQEASLGLLAPLATRAWNCVRSRIGKRV